MDSPIAANVLGTAGAICWSVQLVPQIVVNYRRHHADGVQPAMMLLWAAAGLPLGVYNISRGFNVALQVQPQLLTVLSLLTWAQCRYYGPDSGAARDAEEEGRGPDDSVGTGVSVGVGGGGGGSRVDIPTARDNDYTSSSHGGPRTVATIAANGKRRPLWPHIVLTATAIALVLGGAEIGLVYALRHYSSSSSSLSDHPKPPISAYPYTILAVLSALLLSAGVLRHYWDIYATRSVRGISFLFVGVDALGDLTSLLSLFFEVKGGGGVDVLGVVIYGSELVLWIGVMACGVVFNLRPWILQRRRRRRGKGEG